MVQTTTNIQCYECECEVLDADKVIQNNQIYCQVCFDDNFSTCTDCDKIISHDDELIANDSIYCSDCFNESFFECSSCNSVNSNDYRESHDSDDYCQDCFSDSYTFCTDCNESVARDDALDYDTEPYCEDCYRSKTKIKFTTSDTFNINKSRRFVGIELEYIQIYEPNFGSLGIIKDDGSVSAKDGSNGEGQEFVTYPCNGDLLLKNIDTICKEFKDSEAYINSTCGFHVHLDMRESSLIERERIYRAFQFFESIFFDMTSQSRRDNTYCKSLKGLHYRTALISDRYRSLNLNAFSKYQTFEIRLHQGTINPEKIKNWVTLLLNFFDTFQNIDINYQELTAREKLIVLFQQVKIPLKLKKYMVNRIKKFLTPYTDKYFIKPIKKDWSKHEMAMFLEKPLIEREGQNV